MAALRWVYLAFLVSLTLQVCSSHRLPRTMDAEARIFAAENRSTLEQGFNSTLNFTDGYGYEATKGIGMNGGTFEILHSTLLNNTPPDDDPINRTVACVSCGDLGPEGFNWFTEEKNITEAMTP